MLVIMARESIHAVDNSLQRMQDLKQLLTGELNIGVTYSFSNIMAETMIDFMKKYPKVKLNVCYSSMAELIDKLLRHELDFVLAFKPNERNVHHTLAKEKSITLEQLERYCLAMPAKGLQARNVFDKVTGHTDHHYKIKVEINTIGLLFKLVSQTKYVTVLSESTVIDEPGLRAIPIDVAGNDMEGCIHTLKNGYLKASAHEFISLLGQSTAILKNSTLKGM